MNNRERYLKTMHFEKVDHPPFQLAAPWEETFQRWYREGYPRGRELHDFLEVEPLKARDVNIDTFLIPPFEEKVEYEDDRIVIKRDCFGARLRTFKNQASVPQWLDYAIKTESDLLKLIDRLNPDLEERLPKDWEEKKKKRGQDTDCLTFASGGSYYGTLRNLMGVERLSLMLCDSPDVIKKFNDAYHHLIMTVLEKAFNDLDNIDFLRFGEDFAYKTSSLISPRMYREFIMPYHKAVTDFARSKGVDIFFFDSDGNLNEMLPHLLEGGVNLIFPVECAAGMDPLGLRRKFGKRLRMIGGIDKMEIAKGKEAIKREVLKKVPPLIKEGGYIPCIDHSVPPDIPLEDYLYYIDLLKEIYVNGGAKVSHLAGGMKVYHCN